MASASDCKSTLAATRARIAQLDIEIERLRRLMDPLLTERAKCSQTLANYKYPILTLPAEIMSEIFLQFLPSYPDRPSFMERRAPSYLLQICRRWRDVALATPALWCTMELIFYEPGRYAQQRDLLKMWLQRSGNCALSILLDYLAVTDDNTLVGEVVEELLCHASRWQEVDIYLPIEVLRRIAGAMPLLRGASVGVKGWGERPDAPMALFTDAPVLKHVVLSSGFDPFVLTLPWSQITTLKAEGFYVNEVGEILRHTTMLEECTLIILHGGPSIHSSMILILPLPLRSLRLEYDGVFDADALDKIHQLFEALRLPMLQTLSVDEAFLGPNPIATLSAVFSKGSPQEIEIFSACTPRKDYKAAFPRASVTVHEIGE